MIGLLTEVFTQPSNTSVLAGGIVLVGFRVWIRIDNIEISPGGFLPTIQDPICQSKPKDEALTRLTDTIVRTPVTDVICPHENDIET